MDESGFSDVESDILHPRIASQKGTGEGTFFTARKGGARKSRGFVDDNDSSVFVDNVEL
jgi:hypothetical protein